MSEIVVITTIEYALEDGTRIVRIRWIFMKISHDECIVQVTKEVLLLLLHLAKTYLLEICILVQDMFAFI